MPEIGDLGLQQRRRNAAVLQEYLKRSTGLLTPTGLLDLRAVATAIRGELQGGPDATELVRQAWGHLILMGLVRPDPSQAAGWRPADAPGWPLTQLPGRTGGPVG